LIGTANKATDEAEKNQPANPFRHPRAQRCPISEIEGTKRAIETNQLANHVPRRTIVIIVKGEADAADEQDYCRIEVGCGRNVGKR